MKILFDYSPAYLETKTGIPFFVKKIFEELRLQEDLEIVRTQNLRKYFPFPKSRMYNFFESRVYRKIYIPLKLLFGRYDIYIENQYMFLPLFKPPATTVITLVYDIGIMLFDDINTAGYTHKWRKNFRLSVDNSDVLVTISKSSKRDISTYLGSIGQSAKPLEYVYPSVSLNESSMGTLVDVAIELGIEAPYFLFLGTLEPRKNLLNLLKAFREFKLNIDRGSALKLVIAGRRGWLYSEVLKYIEDNDLSSVVIFTGYITEAQKVSLIKKAEAFLLLSIYEGFGIPVLEALKLGTPALVSDIQVFHEICGANALYADPYDVDHIAKMMGQVIDHPARISSDLFDRFNWTVSGRKLYEIAAKYNNPSFE